jgi:hypothetical protein
METKAETEAFLEAQGYTKCGDRWIREKSYTWYEEAYAVKIENGYSYSAGMVMRQEEARAALAEARGGSPNV